MFISFYFRKAKESHRLHRTTKGISNGLQGTISALLADHGAVVEDYGGETFIRVGER